MVAEFVKLPDGRMAVALEPFDAHENTLGVVFFAALARGSSRSR